MESGGLVKEMNAAEDSATIICAVKDERVRVTRTVESVLRQTYAAREIVVVDGGSQDGTPEYVAERYPEVRIVAGPDDGIYEAMNKGVQAASGAWLLFLGAGDILAADDALAQVFGEEPKSRQNADLIVGRVQHGGSGEVPPGWLGAQLLLRNTLHHQGVLYRRKVFETLRYDEALHVLGDYDLNLRLWQRGARSHRSDVLISIAAGGGISSAVAWLNYSEEIRARQAVLGRWYSWPLDAATILRYVFKWTKHRLL